MPKAILEYQRQCFSEYNHSIGLPENYNFLYGNPILPVVPLDTAKHGVFILGAYPSARFATIGKECHVPVGNNLGPFSEEKYFDGANVHVTASSKELEDLFLKPLGLKRADCWITDMVKVFLFKHGHVAKYQRLGVKNLPPDNRHRFEEYADLSIHWLEEELRLAQPKLLITLGAEVARLLREVESGRQRNALLDGEANLLTMGDVEIPTIHLAHQGILMRPGAKNPWPDRHKNIHIPKVKTFLKRR